MSHQDLDLAWPWEEKKKAHAKFWYLNFELLQVPYARGLPLGFMEQLASKMKALRSLRSVRISKRSKARSHQRPALILKGTPQTKMMEEGHWRSGEALTASLDVHSMALHKQTVQDVPAPFMETVFQRFHLPACSTLLLLGPVNLKATWRGLEKQGPPFHCSVCQHTL